MSSQFWSENGLVEQPALSMLADLGWRTVAGTATAEDADFSRESTGEVVLLKRLKAALARLNPGVTDSALAVAVDAITRDRSAMDMAAANREVYALLKDGVPVSMPNPTGGQKTERVRVVDWERPQNNDFVAVSQFSVAGRMYVCRPDIVGFVNGLPWVVIELKKPDVPAQQAFAQNLTQYKERVPQLFWYNALLVASNGIDSRVGTITADWSRFVEWKRVADESEPRRRSLEVLLKGTCDPTRLLDLAENFTLFSEQKAGLIKVLGQNHQFLGVNNAIVSAMQARERGDGRGGVFWQTQGSGKSFAMVFFAQKVLRKLTGNWTFVIVTDRVELDDQIATTFKGVGAVSASEGDNCHASSSAHLRTLLKGNHRYVFTLIHKFQTPEVLTERNDIIVLTDEAHRSQYNTLALHMRAALPNALFVAFTGTPLIAGEERTRDVFGEYVSIYDFQQSIEDGATVPLFYENRTPELQLVNPDLNDEIYAVIEEASLDEQSSEKLEKLLGQRYQVLTRDDRLEAVAHDIVRHFLARGFMGKAMVVSLDKATAIRMYDKVRAHWEVQTLRVQTELSRRDLTAGEARELTSQRDVLKSTDMAVIVSQGQDEVAEMQARGLDIATHRRRMNESKPPMDQRFKDVADPLRIVFVCAMWLTGFDAPSCSTVYLDKPMRNHTLMQTIARANRVFPGKHSGIIVDYSNVLASLKDALAIYGKGKGGENPVAEKSQLVDSLREAVAEAVAFCADHKVDLGALHALPAKDPRRLKAIEVAVDALISPDPVRNDFLAHQRFVDTLYRAVLPDKSAIEFVDDVNGLDMLAGAIRALLRPDATDLTTTITRIAGVLDASIIGHTIPEGTLPPLDLSNIDFQALAERFKRSKRKNIELEVMKARIRAKLERLVQLNRTRADFAAVMEELIESYNNGSRTIEQLFEELMNLSNNLNEEQSRHVREQLTEEELVIFDILTRPAPELTPAEHARVKAVARELLTKIKAELVINWRKKTSAMSKVKNVIGDELDLGLPNAYSRDIYDEKCASLFQHVYESYPEAGESVYSSVA